jgi:hypothetical protein
VSRKKNEQSSTNYNTVRIFADTKVIIESENRRRDNTIAEGKITKG